MLSSRDAGNMPLRLVAVGRVVPLAGQVCITPQRSSTTWRLQLPWTASDTLCLASRWGTVTLF